MFLDDPALKEMEEIIAIAEREKEASADRHAALLVRLRQFLAKSKAPREVADTSNAANSSAAIDTA